VALRVNLRLYSCCRHQRNGQAQPQRRIRLPANLQGIPNLSANVIATLGRVSFGLPVALLISSAACLTLLRLIRRAEPRQIEVVLKLTQPYTYNYIGWRRVRVGTPPHSVLRRA
jgi:hypothetical protein